MKKRNRGSIALSEEGVKIIRKKVYNEGWTQEEWADQGYTSVSTVKRLLKGMAIDERCFYSLLSVLDLDFQDNLIRKKSEDIHSLSVSAQEKSSWLRQPGLFMTATFTEDKKSQIERAMNHLQKLLINGEIVFSENKGTVTVSGNFSEHNREHIEMTISHLERLFTTCEKTW